MRHNHNTSRVEPPPYPADSFRGRGRGRSHDRDIKHAGAVQSSNNRAIRRRRVHQVVVVIRARRKAAGALFPEGLTIHTPDFTRFARSRELRVAQPLQAQVHGAREVAVVEAADQPQPGGDALSNSARFSIGNSAAAVMTISS